MGDNIYLISLYRKSIEKSDNTKNRIIDRSKSADEYLATDYFDILQVKKRDLKDTFSDIMGIWRGETRDKADTVAQSYPVYCSRETEKKFAGNDKHYGNPFESTEDQKQNYLSIIQVYITPEVMARMTETKDHIWEKAIILEPFMEDLHEIMQDFSQDNPEENFKYQIFHMLSAGDFAVVIRSEKAETSFRISTCIRQRIVKGKAEDEDLKLALYKTYTLLTIYGEEKGKENGQCQVMQVQEAESPENVQFVIRACYSNLYWSNQDKVQEWLGRDNLPEDIACLNGRYDISVHLKEPEFLELLSEIIQYKNGQLHFEEEQPKESADQGAEWKNLKVEYLRFLIRNHYLSCINERILVNYVSRQVIQTISNRIQIEESAESKFLYDRNQQKCDNLLKDYKTIREKVEDIKEYRKNLIQYMNLIHKLILICLSNNKSSDTRIHTIVLCEQLQVVLDSLDKYCEIYKRESSGRREDWLDEIESYLRNAIWVLNSYAGYIRNNNLQTLQMPNYDMESGTSMEKVLIGYSEALNLYINEYLRSSETDSSMGRSYLPIIVPNLTERDISVKVLFEKKLYNKKDISAGRTYMMVVSIPTLSELSEVSVTLTSLLHEAAHQYRYESREERNEVLLNRALSCIADVIVQNMVGRRNPYGCEDSAYKFFLILETCWVKAFKESFFQEDGENGYEYRGFPLQEYKYELKTELRLILNSFSYGNPVKQCLDEFVSVIEEGYYSEDIKWNGILSEISHLLGKLEDEKLEEEPLEQKEVARILMEILTCAEALMKRSMENLGIIEKTEEAENFQNAFRLLKSRFEKVQLVLIQAYGKYKGKRERFLKSLYQNVCHVWESEMKELEKERVISQKHRERIKFGRILGIDCETDENEKVFIAMLNRAMMTVSDNDMRVIDAKIQEYREETADMSMYNIMGLTPFSYINLLASNIPVDMKLPAAYSQRITRVILMKCFDASTEYHYDRAYTHEELLDIYDKFMDICEECVVQLKTSFEVYRKNFPDIEELQRISLKELPVKNDVKIVEWLESFRKQLDSLINRDYAYIVQLTNICRILKSVMERSGINIKRFIGHQTAPRGYLFKDYMCGIMELQKRHEELERSRKGFLVEMNQMFQIVAEMLEHPEYRSIRAEKYEQYNKKCIEFLLKMYYHNKMKYAQEHRENREK